MPEAQTLFYNGRILTGEGLLTGSPVVVSALLVEGGLVLAGGPTASLERMAAPNARRVDLHGRFAMPGFNDAHLHLGEGARLRREANLAGAGSLDEMLARIASYAAATTGDGWLVGGGWDETLWPGSRLPTRHDLDRVTGGRPAVFVRIDVHVSVANTAALALSGVSAATEAPFGSFLDLGKNGELTGILRERAARELVERHIPPATEEERKRDLRLLLTEAAACGLTSVQDNSTDADVAALRALHADGQLPLRVSEWLPFDAPLKELLERRAEAPQDRFFRTTMLKAFLDGSLGSRTAALHEPYSDAPETAGLALYAQEQLSRLARERAAAGFQLGFHAIGDRALDMALTAFEEAASAGLAADGGGGHASRFRIEHAQTASPGAFARAAALGIVASVQPSHLLSDARWTEARLGAGRAPRAHPWRSWAAAGVPLALGTDYPVEPLCPFGGLYAALTRRYEGGLFYPEQRLSLAEALYAYTQGAAYAEHTETWKGMLRPGYVADLVVLDRDLLACAANAPDPTDLLETKVLATVVNGRTIYEAEAGIEAD